MHSQFAVSVGRLLWVVKWWFPGTVTKHLSRARAKVMQPDSLSLREVKTCINSLPFQVSFDYFTNCIKMDTYILNTTEKIAPEN